MQQLALDEESGESASSDDDAPSTKAEPSSIVPQTQPSNNIEMKMDDEENPF